ncbi:MAG: S8 family serine peptidase [bacterium]
MDGTSMATPFVVAVASLARSMRPELSYLQIKDAIINQAEFVSALSGFVAGGKRLNVFRTLQYLYQAQIG